MDICPKIESKIFPANISAEIIKIDPWMTSGAASIIWFSWHVSRFAGSAGLSLYRRLAALERPVDRVDPMVRLDSRDPEILRWS
jgi:hypothetical protein